MSQTMIRVRKDKDNPYLLLNQTSIKDIRLSCKAKGLHVYLLSLPDDWKIYVSELQNHFSDGRDSISSGINELRKFGYIVRDRLQDEKGKFCGYEYQVFEVPQETIEFDVEPTSTENGKSVNGKPVNGLSENGKSVATNYLNIQSTNIQSTNNNSSRKKKEVKAKENNVVVVSPQAQIIIENFKTLYNADLDPKYTKKMIDTKGIEVVTQYVNEYTDYIGGRKINSLGADFYKCVMEGYTKPVAKKVDVPVPQYANFEQRTYIEEDLKKFYANLDE